MWRRTCLIAVAYCLAGAPIASADGQGVAADDPSQPVRFSRHVVAVLNRLGCNAGTCHGAVQGKNGFRLSLFGADPELDYGQIVRESAGRRVDPQEFDRSLLLLMASAQVPHGGGRALVPNSMEYALLRRWLSAGAALDDIEQSRLVKLDAEPREQSLRPGADCRLRVVARFADGSAEDVTALCGFTARDDGIARVDAVGRVTAVGGGETAIIVRYRDAPVSVRVIVTSAEVGTFPEVAAHNFIDRHILTKLRRLNLPPADLADDATFLRRARLDVTGQLPAADEVRAFLVDSAPDKRDRKIAGLLADPGHAALWTLKFCDLLRASDYGIYADGLAEHYEAPRFQAWVRARLAENLPYDEFSSRILGATSREGRALEEWGREVVALQQGYATPRTDLETYARRQTLDIYWQRRGAVGVSGALQVAHAFLGLRLECAQCHRHPHDIWQQDDLLSFANFFMRVRTVGFQGDNEQKFAEDAALFRRYTEEGKQLAEQAKQLAAGKEKQLAEDESFRRQVQELERRGRMLSEEIPQRILHAQIFHRADQPDLFAEVSSPLGTQRSTQFRLLGEVKPIEIPADQDPRQSLIAWLRRPDNPYFARAIVNRVWAHYFGRGIVDPPDDLSPFNPPTHPELLEELSRGFIDNRYDLRWLHRVILTSRTYQQSSKAAEASAFDRSNYASFPLRRLPAEVLIDALDQATGTREALGMEYYHWPPGLKAVEIPYKPQNEFVTFMLEQFGRPPRNSASQCDCERQNEASLLQVLSLANHPHVRQKIADPTGRVAALATNATDTDACVEELYLSVLSRPPDADESQSCRRHIAESESTALGLQDVLWGLLNTREFLLQH